MQSIKLSHERKKARNTRKKGYFEASGEKGRFFFDAKQSLCDRSAKREKGWPFHEKEEDTAKDSQPYVVWEMLITV